MNPAEKAMSLVLNLVPSMYCYMGSGMLTNDYSEEVALSNAKRCAHIAVGELLSELKSTSHPNVTYWMYVDKEIDLIEKL